MTHILIVEDDRMVAAGVSMLLSQALGRDVVICHDEAAAEIVARATIPSAVLYDVSLTDSFRFEGLDFLGGRPRRAMPVILMSGNMTPEIAAEALRRGAAGVLQKPFDGDALRRLLPPASASEKRAVITVPTLDEVLRSDELRPVFQPVICLSDGTVIGYESLARFGETSPWRRPDLLFDYAERLGRVHELEAACVAKTLRKAPALGDGCGIFLNIHPHALSGDGAFASNLLRLAAENEIAPTRLVIELTEHRALGRDGVTISAIEQLHAAGIRFAFDDVGSAHSHLARIDAVRPSFLKISQDFGTGFENHSTRTNVVQNLHRLATDIGADLILEGIETRGTAEAARDLGIQYGQGYYYGRPADAEALRQHEPGT